MTTVKRTKVHTMHDGACTRCGIRADWPGASSPCMAIAVTKATGRVRSTGRMTTAEFAAWRKGEGRAVYNAMQKEIMRKRRARVTA